MAISVVAVTAPYVEGTIRVPRDELRADCIEADCSDAVRIANIFREIQDLRSFVERIRGIELVDARV